MKATNSILVRDWKQDVINLVQFPRCKAIAQVSPFALKLETWLRFNKLNYHNVSNEFTKGSSKGQIPFIELNGRQFADSNLIIDQLISTYNLSIDRNLTTRERAEARAIHVLIEESLFRCLQYNRGRNFSEFLVSEKCFQPYFTGIKKILFEKYFSKKIQSGARQAAQAHGIGRLTPDEVDEVAKKDLTALSTLLGDKHYLFGDRPSTVDATLFGHLCQFTDTPLASDKIRPFMEQNTPNLLGFIKRVKAEYWPDWDAICANLAMNPSDIKPPEGTTIVTSPTT